VTFVPTPIGELPTPDEVLARLSPGAGEDPQVGYITPDDLAFAWQAFLSSLTWLSTTAPPATTDEKDGMVLVVGKAGEPPLWRDDLRELILHLGDVTDVGVNGGLVAVLAALDERLHALEAATPSVPGPAIPVSEGALEVDLYSGSFVRVRDTGHLLDDGLLHSVHLAVATVAGPGGEVFADANAIPTGTQPTWFDANGALGYVDTAAGAHVTQTGLRNWTKYGVQSEPNHYVLYVRKTVAADDASKPLLVVESAVTVA
jgi:hypothetical protein